MIRFENVSFGYGLQKQVLRDFSLTIPDGARICLTGPSGVGKTTVLRLLLGLEKPRRGAVSAPEGIRFSAVFQEDRLLPWKTVLENAALFGDSETASAVLTALGLGDCLNALPETLSGGMKRRAALGRALAHPFDVLVLDEALTGLDSGTKARCYAAIDAAVGGRTLVMTAHDTGDARALGAEIVAI